MTFPISEFQTRLAKTKQRMVNEGVDLLIVTDPANMNYLSGYDAWSFYVHQMLIVILEDEQPIWVGRGQDASAALHTTWLDSNHIVAYGDHYVQSDIRHPMDFVSDLLRKKKCDNKTIAVELDAYYFTARSYMQLTKGLPNATFKDGTNMVNWVRIIKSEREISYIKHAAKISEQAMQAAFDTINEGVRECDVVANISHAQISGTEDFGGDYPSIVPLLPTGDKTSASHLTWTDNRFKQGDPVIIELAGCYKRYHSPLARTAVIGSPDETMQYVSDVVIEGINTTLDAAKPGITCEELERVWRSVIEKSGIKKESRMGYSMGLNYPPDWGEHTASLRPGDRTVLEPNMTFHLIPGIWMDHMGVEISESFQVTETGCEVLADFPRDLMVKPNIRLA
ncbi:M24 family metallopeptidase [Lentibacillus cibarius]|uniref:M24 family metallopeptidase n=1 Tax=Lentibacillus cibarius TaxID=2583219 RepID=A0A549YMP1_9BACI|nr:M24 family metallopeptidase [Lentibacillus cibarius]TMN23792.1 M24 family metallopeptidase [Lentibacillus cibarius]TRM13146.1 M24 family metallopeptidase [Lentibacillus cibarius]